MNVNVVFEIQYNKGKLFVKTVRLNEKDAIRYEFPYDHRPVDQHPTVFPNPVRLPRRSQSAYRTLKGDEIDIYFDLANFHFIFKGEVLLPIAADNHGGNKECYDLQIRPIAFLKSLETKAFLSLPASERAERLFNLIPKPKRAQFTDALAFGYDAVREQFLGYFNEAYTEKAQLIYFQCFNPGTDLCDFVEKFLWYFSSHLPVDFDIAYKLLIENYLPASVIDFFESYPVSDAATLRSNAKLWNKIQSIEHSKRESSQMIKPTKSFEKQTKIETFTPPNDRRLMLANNKYSTCMKSIRSGSSFGIEIHNLNQTDSSFATELQGDPVINYLSSQTATKATDKTKSSSISNKQDDPNALDKLTRKIVSNISIDKQTRLKDANVDAEEDQPMEIEKQLNKPINWNQNIMGRMDSQGVPLLDPAASISKRNAKRPKSRQIDIDAPIRSPPTKSAKKTNGKKGSKDTPLALNTKTITKRKVTRKALGLFNPHAVLTRYSKAYVSPPELVITRSIAKAKAAQSTGASAGTDKPADQPTDEFTEQSKQATAQSNDQIALATAQSTELANVASAGSKNTQEPKKKKKSTTCSLSSITENAEEEVNTLVEEDFDKLVDNEDAQSEPKN